MFPISFDQNKIKEFCQSHHIRRLAFFGSILRPDFRPDSDIDILVEFEKGHTPGFEFFAFQTELSELFGRRVDLHTPAFLSHYFRDRVMKEARVQYAA